jgi:hypothetical protein
VNNTEIHHVGKITEHTEYCWRVQAGRKGLRRVTEEGRLIIIQ